LKLTMKIRYTEKNILNWLWKTVILEKMTPPFKILVTPMDSTVSVLTNRKISLMWSA
jgi:hypothetical protein